MLVGALIVLFLFSSGSRTSFHEQRIDDDLQWALGDESGYHKQTYAKSQKNTLLPVRLFSERKVSAFSLERGMRMRGEFGSQRKSGVVALTAGSAC
jgi:hypothetical protein